jgi:hypothetical protein
VQGGHEWIMAFLASVRPPSYVTEHMFDRLREP